jgi:uncharacterized protein (TIGR00725 family)
VKLAEELGERAARAGWIVLTGGREAGVMRAALRGAKKVEGSLTVGILPGRDRAEASPFADVAIATGMGEARNIVNVLSSDVVVACGAGGPGTASEAALALKAGKPLVLLAPSPEAAAFFAGLGAVRVAETAAAAVEIAERERPRRRLPRRRTP